MNHKRTTDGCGMPVPAAVKVEAVEEDDILLAMYLPGLAASMMGGA